MFSSLESFSVFFFSGLILIILGIIFEEKLITLEKKIGRWYSNKKYYKSRYNSKNKISK